MGPWLALRSPALSRRPPTAHQLGPQHCGASQSWLGLQGDEMRPGISCGPCPGWCGEQSPRVQHPAGPGSVQGAADAQSETSSLPKTMTLLEENRVSSLKWVLVMIF